MSECATIVILIGTQVFCFAMGFLLGRMWND